MQAAIERVMTTYGMLVHLTPEQEREARERVAKFLEGKGSDEHMLAVEGLKYLRSSKLSPPRGGWLTSHGVQ